MGVETAIAAGALASGGAAIFGANEARKGRKDAKKEMESARQEQSRANQRLETERKRLADESLAEKKRLNAGIARSGRRRIKGGLFGESEKTMGPVSSTLG